MKKTLLAIAAATLLTQGAWALDWTVNPATSKLGWQARFNGQEVNGIFKTWKSQINFDPANLATSSITIEVDVSSVDSADASRDETLRSADWFNAGQFATAKFTSSKITATPNGDIHNRYVAAGTLTINGVSKPLALPFTVNINGSNASAQGELTLSRGAFNVGQGPWKNNAEIADLVKVTYTVNATTTAQQ